MNMARHKPSLNMKVSSEDDVKNILFKEKWYKYESTIVNYKSQNKYVLEK